MDKKKIIEALKKAKEDSKKRNFIQSLDLIINLKDINLKNPEEHVDLFTKLPHNKGKKVKICALVGPELKEEAKKVCDLTIDTDEFPKYQGNKKELKQLANNYDFFIAQANIMANIAKVFGKVLGSRGKMPNPKAGCVVPPKTNLKPLYDNLQNTVRLLAKTSPVIYVCVGKEDMDNEIIAENVLSLYNTLIHSLQKEENNISSIIIKTTMGKPTRLEK
ncbi:MAG: 50S ribosomal protein L1 [Candidatus Woesearchaeota archaeon]